MAAYQTITERNDRFQILDALKRNRKKRSELGEVFVEGIQAIKQGLESPWAMPERLLIADPEGLSDWAKNLISSGRFASVVRLRRELFDELCDKTEPAELMATFKMPRRNLGDISLPDKPLILIFDRPSDQGNLGTLIRSANAFGVDLFVTHGHCADPFDPKTIRSSLGAVFRTPIVHEDSFEALETWLGALKAERGLTLAGSDSDGEVELGSAPIGRPVALVLGNEAKGMSLRLKGILDLTVRIPMEGAVDSLNVSCAGSILLWESARLTLAGLG
jgi:TrmH family RNA methyltransferase